MPDGIPVAGRRERRHWHPRAHRALQRAVGGWLLVAGATPGARALACFIPDCLVVFRRLVRDERVPRRRKLLLAALIGYLALPCDLVPDFIPVAGQARRRDRRRARAARRAAIRRTRPTASARPGPDVSLNAPADHDRRRRRGL
jgi:uncharacterized protein DUF1232